MKCCVSMSASLLRSEMTKCSRLVNNVRHAASSLLPNKQHCVCPAFTNPEMSGTALINDTVVTSRSFKTNGPRIFDSEALGLVFIHASSTP